MIYTQGIRKIFKAEKPVQFQELGELAYQAGYRLLFFNGAVYQMVARVNWIETPLKLEDFEVKF